MCPERKDEMVIVDCWFGDYVNKENKVFKDGIGVKGLRFKLHGNNHGSHGKHYCNLYANYHDNHGNHNGNHHGNHGPL